MLIVKEWVIPTQTAALNNQIVSLTSQLGQIKDLTNEKKGAETKIKTLEAELAKANANLRGAQLANLFSAGNPYPVGLASVRVGDPISRVDQVYEASAVDKEASPAFWSVRVKHAAFRSATYYFDPDSRRQEISQVLFHFSGGSGGSLANIKLIGEQPPSKVVRELFRDPDGEALLLGKLTEALGTPRFLEKEKRYLWIVGPLEVTMDKDGSGRSFLVRKR